MLKYRFILLLVLSSCLNVMAQSNYRIENFGNRSILLSGNVTGSVEDLGLTYYNPARLALIDNPKFTINAKAYQWSEITLTNAIGYNNKLGSSSFNGLPSMLAGTFKIKSLENSNFAYSIITKIKSQTSFNYETDILDEDFLDDFAGDEKYTAKFNLNNRVRDEWFGITWSKSFSENFSIGVTTFASIYSHKGSNIIKYASLNSQSEVAIFDKEVSFKQESYGLYWKIGLAWQYPKIEFGLNITPPYLEVYGEGRVKYSEYLTGIPSTSDIFIYNYYKDLKSTKKVPFGVDFGVGIPIGKSKIHLSVDWHGKVSAYDRIVIPTLANETGDPIELRFTEKLTSVFNYGLGAEIYINPKFNGYLSFSSDYSPILENSSIYNITDKQKQDVNLIFDLFHFGFGIDMKMKRSHLILGGAYTTGSSIIDRPVDELPGTTADNNLDNATLKLNRWRFIIGLDIPILTDKLK